MTYSTIFLAILVVDASEGVTDQDARLARLIDTNDRAMVIVCNKWDLAAKAGRKVPAFVRDVHDRYPFLDYATVVFTSAKTGDGPTSSRKQLTRQSSFPSAGL